MPLAFSHGFLVQQGLNGASSTVTVPAGRVYVIKQLTWYSNPLLGVSRGFFRDLDSGATLFSCGTNTGTPGWFGFYGALTFSSGRRFRWEVSAELTDGADVYAGGYDLSDSA